jgi:hypothetical protein
MRVFLDASVIVESALLNSDKFEKADALLQSGACTSIHALAEAYTPPYPVTSVLKSTRMMLPRWF